MADPQRWPVTATLDDIFVGRYSKLVSQAQQLTGGDRAAAEDLVHDTFVRLSLRDLNPAAVENLEGYLFVTMRNVHLSQVRRRVLQAPVNVSVVDYHSIADRLLAVVDERAVAAAYEELTLVARYACLRKQTSKAARALILRFFHGYYPGEIARILHATDQAVDTRLRMARAEARAFVAAPDRLVTIERRHPRDGDCRMEVDFVVRLRASIFDAVTDDCPTTADFDRVYSGPSTDPLDVRTLAHVVSCARCLDTLNRRLGLPLLQDRDPSDMLGRGRRSGGGGTSGGTPVGAGHRRVSLRTRLNDVLNERPKELRVAINGFFVGSQAVSGGFSEQRIRVLTGERIGFVEVFSEHDVCLFYADITPPPDGLPDQGGRVELAGGKSLSLRLKFQDPDPLVEVVYCDPQLDFAQDADAPREGRGRTRRRVEAVGARGRVAEWWARWRRRPLRPVLASFACVVVLTSIWWLAQEPTVSAAELVNTARAGEATPPAPGTASHRILSVEQRTRPASTVVRRSRVEVWHDGTRGIRARRLYDDESRVVAGLWTAPDGTRTRYEIGQEPTVEGTAASATAPTVQDMWTRDLSADAFVELVGSLDDAKVLAGFSTYVITHRTDLAPGLDGLVEASLTLAKGEPRAIEQLIVIREDGREHEFQLNEVRAEVLPIERLGAAIFDPEPALLGLTAPPISALPTVAPQPIALAAPPVVPVESLDEIELAATYRLFRARLWVGDRADVMQSGTSVVVTARAASDAERAAIETGLESIPESPQVELDISLAAASIESSIAPPSGLLTTMPGYAMFEGLVSLEPAATREARVAEFVADLQGGIDRRRVRLKALAELIHRWSDDRLGRLRLDTVVTWQVMVHDHADAVGRETAWLRTRLATLGPRPADDATDDAPVGPPLQTVTDAAAALADLSWRLDEQDQVLRAALTPCAVTTCAEPDAAAILQSFADLETAVSRFARFYLRVGRGGER